MTDQCAAGGYRSAILNLDSPGKIFIKVDIIANPHVLADLDAA